MSRRPAHQAWEKRKGGGRRRPSSRPSSLARCGHPEGKQTLKPVCLPGWTPAEVPHRRGSTLPAPHTHASGLGLQPDRTCCLRFYLATLGSASPGALPTHPRTLGNPAGRLPETRCPAAPLGLQVTVCFETGAAALAWIGRVKGTGSAVARTELKASQAAASLPLQAGAATPRCSLAEGEGRVRKVLGFVGHMSSPSHV